MKRLILFTWWHFFPPLSVRLWFRAEREELTPHFRAYFLQQLLHDTEGLEREFLRLTAMKGTYDRRF